ncbi:MAG: Gp15 family bacteriophage protein [Eubacteriales bacterium]
MAFNLLTDPLPETLLVSGRRYPMRTDFRRWILVAELLAEEGVDAGRKALCAAELIFPRENPLERVRLVPLDGANDADDAEDAASVLRETVRGMLWFASCGRWRELPDGTGETRAEAPVFDFTADAERIFAAFWQTYALDLCAPETRLHYWKFMALLRSLPAETEFMQVVRLRGTDTTKIGDDDLRRRVRRAKAGVRIRKTEEEKEKWYG